MGLLHGSARVLEYRDTYFVVNVCQSGYIFKNTYFCVRVNNLVFLAFQYINDLEKDRQYWGWPKDLQEVCGVLFNTVLLQIVQNCLFIFSYLAFFGTLARRMHLGFCVKLSEDNGTGVDRDVRFKAKSL